MSYIANRDLVLTDDIIYILRNVIRGEYDTKEIDMYFIATILSDEDLRRNTYWIMQFIENTKPSILDNVDLKYIDSEFLNIYYEYRKYKKVFCVLCEKGDICAVQWMLKWNPHLDINEIYEKALRSACICNQLELAKWLSILDNPLTNITKKTLEYTIILGYKDVYIWLYELLLNKQNKQDNVIQDKLDISSVYLLEKTCMNCQNEAIDWLMEINWRTYF